MPHDERNGTVNSFTPARVLFASLTATLPLAGSVLSSLAAAASGGQSGENASGAADGGDADGGRSGTGVSMRLDEITPWLDDKGHP